MITDLRLPYLGMDAYYKGEQSSMNSNSTSLVTITMYLLDHADQVHQVDCCLFFLSTAQGGSINSQGQWPGVSVQSFHH